VEQHLQQQQEQQQRRLQLGCQLLTWRCLRRRACPASSSWCGSSWGCWRCWQEQQQACLATQLQQQQGRLAARQEQQQAAVVLWLTVLQQRWTLMLNMVKPQQQL
jgi:hypothetical protein